MLDAGQHGRPPRKPAVPHQFVMPDDLGAYRLVVRTDEAGNQALGLESERAAVYVMCLPADKPEADRRVIKDAFAAIGKGLTKIDERIGEGEWHPPFRSKVTMPTERVEGAGPFTPEGVAEFVEVLDMARQRLGQVCTFGFVVPAGFIIECWGSL